MSQKINVALFKPPAPNNHIVLQWTPLNGIMNIGIYWLMGSNLSNLTYHFLPNVCLVRSLISINRLQESVSLGPKNISLSCAHCSYLVSVGSCLLLSMGSCYLFTSVLCKVVVLSGFYCISYTYQFYV